MANNHSEIEKRLWASADELRANSKLKSSEYSVPVLGLIFLRYTDPRGIESRSYYDAMGRTTKTIQAFTGTGAVDDAYPSRNKTTEFAYDGSGHLIEYRAWLNETDFELTEYIYPRFGGTSIVKSNDLLSSIVYPDTDLVGPAQAQFSYTYNALGERIAMTDINGTTHEYSFDVVGRPIADAVTDLGGGVDGSAMLLTTDYDSAGRAYRFTSWDAVAEGNAVNRVLRKFNGFGQLTHEYQGNNAEVVTTVVDNDDEIDEDPSYADLVQYVYSTEGNFSRLESMLYPDGAEITYSYDAVGRLLEEEMGPVNEAYDYLGFGTVVYRGGDVVYQQLYGTGGPGDGGDQYDALDRFGRVVDVSWFNSSDNLRDHFTYGYDRNGNRLYRTNELDHDFDELYHASQATSDADRYDKLNQLTAFSRGELTDSNSDGVLDEVATATREQSWSMDGLGNFTSVTTDTVTENREHDLQNRLVGIDSTPLTYDDNGNLLEDDQSNEYTYDAWNRMITVNESARYAYDSLGRRVKEGDCTLVYSATWQVLEEQVADEALYQYVWSPVYVDAMVARIEYGSSEMMMMMSQESEWNPETREWEMPLELSSMLTSEPVQILYVLQDANFNVTALVADNGDVVERYVYDPYGKFEVYQGDDWQNPIADSNYAWVYLHQGGRWDVDAELFSFRNRDYSARLMRWVEQDPIQFAMDESNLYRYCGNNSIVSVDPLGLDRRIATWFGHGVIEIRLSNGTIYYLEFGPDNGQGAFRVVPAAQYWWSWTLLPLTSWAPSTDKQDKALMDLWYALEDARLRGEVLPIFWPFIFNVLYNCWVPIYEFFDYPDVPPPKPNPGPTPPPPPVPGWCPIGSPYPSDDKKPWGGGGQYSPV